MQAPPEVALLPGYTALANVPGNEFPAGTIQVAGHEVGVLKIRLFSPRAFPELCESALVALQITDPRACDDACTERIEAWGAERMTRDLETTIRAIKAAGAEILLVDVAGNGGGSDWEQAAVRMVTAVRIRSARMGFVRGEHWAKRWANKEAQLRTAASKCKGEDRAFLLSLADSVASRRREAQSACDSEPLWRGKRPTCQWLGDAFYSSGLVDSDDTGRIRQKPWGKLVFTPTKYPYQEGIWSGPLLVLVTGGTGSAAEQFAAELQDNFAALIIGTTTVGAGCGHTDGGTPTILKNSRAVLELPDCVRFRSDGSNLASGIQPDILIGLRNDDGQRRRGSILAGKLVEAVERATGNSREAD
jgi:C-terminal processing protease CtpA/Prc